MFFPIYRTNQCDDCSNQTKLRQWSISRFIINFKSNVECKLTSSWIRWRTPMIMTRLGESTHVILDVASWGSDSFEWWRLEDEWTVAEDGVWHLGISEWRGERNGVSQGELGNVDIALGRKVRGIAPLDSERIHQFIICGKYSRRSLQTPPSSWVWDGNPGNF